MDVPETREADLSDDSAELATRGRDTVAGGAVASGERLTGHDERRRVRAKVLEEVGEAVEEDERLLGARRRDELVVAEAHAAEEYGEHGEAHELDRLAAPRVDEQEGGPVAGDEAGGGQDHVADANVLQVGVDLEAASQAL